MQAANKTNQPTVAATNNQESAMTGYKLAKIVNVKLAEVGLKTIPAQMVYNYMKNDYISKTDENAQLAWIETYVSKRIEKASKVEIEA
jgi:hypothetical protein